MRWRVTITHAVEGSVVMSEPEGLVSAIIGLTRHPTFHTLVKEFKSSFRAYGSNGTQDGRRDWIKNIEALYGPDAVVTILIEYAPNNFTFETLYNGEIGIQTIVEGLEFDHYLEFTPVQTGMWRKFISRYDVPVDIQSAVDLDGNSVPVITPDDLKLTSQVINKTASFFGHSGDVDTAADCQVATTGNIVLSGIQTIDGEPGSSGRRVAVKDNTDQRENGIWVEDVGAWSRAADANTNVELENLIFKVTGGSVNSGKTFKQYTTPVTIGVSNIVFAEYNYVDDVVLVDDNINTGTHVYTDFFAPVTTTNKNLDEITSTFELPFIVVPRSGTSGTDYTSIGDVIELSGQETGVIEFNYITTLRFRYAPTASGGVGITGWDWRLNIQAQINDGPVFNINADQFQNIPGASTNYYTTWNINISNLNLPDDILAEHNFVQGDRLRLFFRLGIKATGSPSGVWSARRLYGGIVSQTSSFTFRSTFTDSNIESFLIHDVASSIMDRITEVDKFYSEYIGSQYTQARAYLSAGPWWNNMLFKGVHARGYTLSEKLFSLSFKDLWEGLEPMLNLSLGYETIEDEERIVMRSKAEAYDSSSMSVLLSGVQRIKRKYGPDYFNGAKFGANKGKTEDINGLDDPHSRTVASILKNIGRVFTNTTNFIYQSLTIEQARRTTKIKSADYKFDDDIFIVEATRTAANAYQPRLNEDFVSVTNLNNEASRYNKHHTPARFLLRWLNYISGGLQKYLGTVFRFTGGEGNYDMVSTMINGSAPDDYGGNALAENADILVGTTYLWVPKVFEIEHYLTFEEFKTIDQNRNIAIGVSQSYEDHKEFFIDDLQFEIMSGQVKITGKFKDEFDIITVPPGGQIFQGGRIFDATFDFSFE